jgi:hypothetical protein
MAHMIERLNTDEELTIAPAKNGKIQRAGESLGIAAGRAVSKSREFVTLMRDRAYRVRQRAEQVKDEKPLQILAVFAGLSVVAGFATRMWRASKNA